MHAFVASSEVICVTAEDNFGLPFTTGSPSPDSFRRSIAIPLLLRRNILSQNLAMYMPTVRYVSVVCVTTKKQKVHF